MIAWNRENQYLPITHLTVIDTNGFHTVSKLVFYMIHACPQASDVLHWMQQRLRSAPYWGHPWAGWLLDRERGLPIENASRGQSAADYLHRALTLPGFHRLSPVTMKEKQEACGAPDPRHRRFESWDALDAFVLKGIALLLTPLITQVVPRVCFHLPGRGGMKGAIRAVRDAIASGRYPFIAKSDAKGYYANIRHATLLAELRQITSDPTILDLVCQLCHRTVVVNGCYRRVEKGIPLGCSVSPLLAALYLRKLDQRLSRLPGVFYVRFMDDWVILAETRWKLRRAIRIMNETLDELSLQQHPDKTWVGPTERGFEFLGYQFASDGSLFPSERALARRAEKLSRLYEQGADDHRLGEYRQRWQRWFHAALETASVDGNDERLRNPTKSDCAFEFDKPEGLVDISYDEIIKVCRIGYRHPVWRVQCLGGLGNIVSE
ncbi:MAG: reverse transcriptase/maturase family protein [Verrucomicrobiota bacterium]